MFVLCVLYSKDKKGQKPDNQGTRTDKMQRGNKIKEIPVKARFSAPVQTGPGAHPASQLPIQWIPGVFAGGKTAGVWR